MKVKLLIIISLILASLMLGSCKDERKPAPKPKVSRLKGKAIKVATEAAKQLVETDHTDTLAMQNCILEAKAMQAEFQLADDSIAVASFNKAYKQYLEENDPNLAKEIFVERPKDLPEGAKWDEFEELEED
jgi:PBP1b-binding outer membrane lipoprotein LpoB